jgi:type IX secretion system PorP/SprF family membrane protein
MKLKFLRITLVFCGLSGSVLAQQDMMLTHFIFDKMRFNPGATGMDEGICATTMYRNQWDKVNGAPNSAVLNVEANMNRFFPGGLGISFYHDAIAFTRQNNVLLNYSYPLEIPGAGVLGIGVGVGIQNFGMSPTWEPPSTLNDPTLPVGYASTKLDMNFGLYFKGTSGYYAGISSTHLPASFYEAQASLVGGSTAGDFDMVRHYYLTGGYKYQDIVTDGDIEGNILVRTDMIKYSADINARFIWRDVAYGGLTYRTSDAIAVMLGAQPLKLMNGAGAPDLTVGYSYDVNINKLSSVSRGSHEILLKYCYYLPPIPIQKTKHPRWL